MSRSFLFRPASTNYSTFFGPATPGLRGRRLFRRKVECPHLPVSPFTRQFYISSLAILLFPTFAYAAEPALALECRGVKSNSPDIQYELTLTALNENSVVVIDTSTKETCNCKFRQSDFFDQSQGMVPGYIISMDFQSCDEKCPQSLKRQIKAHIRVTHRLIRKETYSTPFVGDQISNCDRFSINVPMLRRIEAQSIDSMTESPEFRAKLKALKGVGDSESAAVQDGANEQPRR